ncbi:hypothetical protein AN217_19605 [Streptomyces qinglanensis]|uniref:DUF397 domain-containing protein n=1 Tax=Streptomyces qinglanensis TaxID=943816 RepID=A0A1E7K6V3_9ACTN|nr:DUF397 domain-containing protein [Streptomyces qinglanensis]OEU99650.1 hypothetical protein AN217_19605 [Streptomyces qinglanensis]OEV25268.1 hypothetical protein AN220_14680 [Streptomyces nanshensis]
MADGSRTAPLTCWWYSSGSGNNCVEVAGLAHAAYQAIAIRDSKNSGGPALLFEPEGIVALVADVRDGSLTT